MAGNFNLSYILQIIDKMSPALSKIVGKLRIFSNQIKKTDFVTKGFGNSLNNIGKKAYKLGKTLSLRVSAPMILLGRSILKAGMEMENINVVFKAMLGTTEKATEMIEEIWKMSKKTTFSFDQLARSSKLLLNFGVEAKKVTPLLRMLGDISDGNSQRFNVLSYNLAQVASLGKLTGIDLKSLRLSGFTPLKIISDETGISMAKLEKIMSKGGISFEQVAKAMKIATSEGGRFYNRMEIMSKTASGKLNIAMKEFSRSLTSLGVIALPYFTKFVEKLTLLIQKFNNLSPRTKKFILIIIAIGAAIAPLLIILGILAISFAYVTGVVLLLAGAIASFPFVFLIGGFVYLISKLKIVRKAITWILKKMGFIDKGKSEFNQNINKTTQLNSNSSLDLSGVFTFANAPKGSSFKMTPMAKNVNSNLGANMSYAR